MATAEVKTAKTENKIVSKVAHQSQIVERVSDDEITLTAPVFEFNVSDRPRKWINANLDFLTLMQYSVAKTFNASHSIGKTQGEQRKLKDGHVAKLLKDMVNGDFTPASLEYGLSSPKQVKYNQDGTVTITISKKSPLRRLDGNHRLESIHEIHTLADNPEIRTRLDSMVLPAILLLDGDLQRDFVNLQAGAAVDKTHMLQVKIKSGYGISDELQPLYKNAVDIAHKLHETAGSPLANQIRFDSSGNNAVPLQSIIKSGSSDRAVSLLGTAMVLDKMVDKIGVNQQIPFATQIVLELKTLLDKECPECTTESGLLRTDGGKLMNCQFFIGVLNLAIYRIFLEGQEELTPKMKKSLIFACNRVFRGLDPDEKTSGNTLIRATMGEYARLFFADYAADADTEIGVVGVRLDDPEGIQGGIPITLCELFSYSSFGLSRPPKPLKAKAQDMINKDELNKIAEEAQAQSETRVEEKQGATKKNGKK